MDSLVKFEFEIDIVKIHDIVNDASDLNDNQEMFGELVKITRVKKQLELLLDQVTSIELEAKSAIKGRATELYGANWSAIAGNGYKITKSATGAVFSVLPDATPDADFYEAKLSLNSKLVENYVKETGKLPEGIEYNSTRGSSIRITVKDEDSKT